MAVRLTVERRVIPGAQAEITKLLRELRSAAVRQPGFVSGETVVDAFNPLIFLTISTWTSMSAWERWDKSPERLAIVERINALLQAKPVTRLWVDDIDAPPAAA